MSVFGFGSRSWSSSRVSVEVEAGGLFWGGCSERIFSGSSRGLEGTVWWYTSVGVLSIFRISSVLEAEFGLGMSLLSFVILLFEKFWFVHWDAICPGDWHM